jgi:N-acetylglutamate synthase/N-acetylornithine aminotransferase
MTHSAVSGGITSPRGFRAAGVSAGIKANHGLDLALIVSDSPACAAAVFTTNLAVAAPVVVSRDHLARSAGAARAVVVNSGCANACTGDDGLAVARAMASETAALVAARPNRCSSHPPGSSAYRCRSRRSAAACRWHFAPWARIRDRWRRAPS